MQQARSFRTLREGTAQHRPLAFLHDMVFVGRHKGQQRLRHYALNERRYVAVACLPRVMIDGYGFMCFMYALMIHWVNHEGRFQGLALRAGRFGNVLAFPLSILNKAFQAISLSVP